MAQQRYHINASGGLSHQSQGVSFYWSVDFIIKHYNDVRMTAMASQITSLTVVYSTVYSDADQRKHQAPRHWPLCGEFTGTGGPIQLSYVAYITFFLIGWHSCPGTWANKQNKTNSGWTNTYSLLSNWLSSRIVFPKVRFITRWPG